MSSITDYSHAQIYPPACTDASCKKQHADAVRNGGKEQERLHTNTMYMAVADTSYDRLTLLFKMYLDEKRPLKVLCQIPDASDEKLCKELSFKVRDLQKIAGKALELGYTHKSIMERLHKEGVFIHCLTCEKYKKDVAPIREREIHFHLDPCLPGMHDFGPIITGYANSTNTFEALNEIYEAVERLKKERGVSDDLQPSGP